MVNFASFSLLALGLVSSQALAAPATVTATRSKSADAERFSFAKWVDTIIANPDTALSPQEAWQAYLDSINSTTTNAPSLGAVEPVHEKRRDPQVDCTNWGGSNQAKYH
ncbi:hypothetical protein N0V85_003883 [Neurospora sp. IMI 360204]|nr:hypothetical protein N0V85_003883 [Neurospora sp. IMI 360204]